MDSVRTAINAGLPHRFPLQLRYSPHARQTNSTPKRTSSMKALVTKGAPLLNGGVGISTPPRSGTSARSRGAPRLNGGVGISTPVSPGSPSTTWVHPFPKEGRESQVVLR